jgi:phosphoribosyl-dephospho-CoA transferase
MSNSHPHPEEPQSGLEGGPRGSRDVPEPSFEATLRFASRDERAEGIDVARLRRHALVRVDPAAWATLLADRPDLAGVPILAGWAAAGWPLIVRRFSPGEDRARVPLGLPLPPALGKRRIGLLLPADVLAPCPAPSLAEARIAAPLAWHSTLDALVALGARHGLVPRPFGALLWQTLTSLPYLTERSDLDLLWLLAGPLPDTFLDALATLAAAAPMVVDGEIVLADGGGVQWREWHGAGDGSVLVKYRDRLEMRSAGLSSSLPEGLVPSNPLILRCCEAASKEDSRSLCDRWNPPSRLHFAEHLRMRAGIGEIEASLLREVAPPEGTPP